MPTSNPSLPGAIRAGLVGSVAMTGCHETIRRLVPRAPRLDSLGRRALARVFRSLEQTPPDRDTLQILALAGDVVFNAGLFATAVVVGPPASAPIRGLAVGTLAGLATLALPPKLKIGPDPGRLTTSTKVITLGLYVGGGLVAGLIYRRRLEREGAGGS